MKIKLMILRVTKWPLILILVMAMSGCTITNVLAKCPVMKKDAGILISQKKYSVPLFDSANLMKFSPDNRYLVATGGYSRHINIYDVESGKIVKRFLKKDKKNNWGVSANVDFSSDGRYLILRNVDDSKYTIGNFHLVDLETFEIIQSVIPETKGTGGDMYFSEDGKYFAFNNGSSLTSNPRHYGKSPIMSLYDAKTWKLVTVGPKKGFDGDDGAIFSHDGKYLIDIGRLVDTPDLNENSAPVIRFWSIPDLKLERTIDGFFRPYRIVPRTKKHKEYGFEDMHISIGIGSMKISHDGQIMAVHASNDETVAGLGGTVLINLKSGKLINSYDGPSGTLGFSPTSKYLLASRQGIREDRIFIFDIPSFEVLDTVAIEQTNAAIDTAYSPDGTKVAMSQGRIFWVWDVKEHK